MGNATPQDQWEEYLAMYIVEDTFPYGRFKKMECSDLHGDDVGIEVIRARPKTFEERRNYIRRVLRETELERPPAKKYGSITICGADARTIDKSLLLAALRKKEAKLNQGHYKEFQQQGLFIFSLVTSFSEAPHGEALKWPCMKKCRPQWPHIRGNSTLFWSSQSHVARYTGSISRRDSSGRRKWTKRSMTWL